MCDYYHVLQNIIAFWSFKLFLIKHSKRASLNWSFDSSPMLINLTYNLSGSVFMLFVSILTEFYKLNIAKFSIFLSSVAENNIVYQFIFFV